jgi:hypothetical protein
MKKCRVGDLALIIRASYVENIGKLVRVVGLQTRRFGVMAAGKIQASNADTDWLVEPISALVLFNSGEFGVVVPDNWLMPIRPSDEKFLEDELTRELEGVQ